jgi:hypothetical protein
MAMQKVTCAPAPTPSPEYVFQRALAREVGLSRLLVAHISNSIPKLLRARGFALWRGWACWALWTTGVALRWIANVYAWHWRALLPISAVLELCAFLLFFTVVTRHRAPGPQKHFDSWVLVVITGTMGLGATLLLNVSAAFYLGLYSDGHPSRADPTRLTKQAAATLPPWFAGSELAVAAALRPGPC